MLVEEEPHHPDFGQDDVIQEYDNISDDIRRKNQSGSNRSTRAISIAAPPILHEDDKMKLAVSTSRASVPGAVHYTPGERPTRSKPSQFQQLDLFSRLRRTTQKQQERGPIRHKHDENIDFTHNDSTEQEHLDDFHSRMNIFKRQTNKNVDAEDQEGRKRRRKYIAFIVVGVLVVVAGIVVGVTVGLKPKKNSSEDQPVGTRAFDVTTCHLSENEGPSERSVMIHEIITSEFSQMADAISNEGSTAWAALCWLANFDEGDVSMPNDVIERFALASFYLHFAGTDLSIVNGLSRRNWFTPAHVCDWYNVSCDESGDTKEVTGLQLAALSLSGSIPSELMLLRKLTSLRLPVNSLSGTIPSEIWMMNQLEAIEFNTNQLSGTLPNAISDLSQLTDFSVSANRLFGAIPNVGGLTNLVDLDLSNNPFVGMFPNVSDLVNLAELRFHSTEITGTIPSFLGSLTRLRYLSMGNSLSGTIPSEIGSLTELRKFTLRDSPVDGTIPTELGQLSRLELLELMSLKELIGSIPSELGQLSDLERLSFEGSSGLTGSIPAEVCLLRSRKLTELIGWCIGCPPLCPALV